MRQCVILVGGLGSRLGKHTESKPKPLLDICGRPFIEYLIEKASAYGCREVLLLAGYLGDQFIEKYDQLRLENGGCVVVHQEQQLSGTGGALLDAWDKIDSEFILLNGDSILDADWTLLEKALIEQNIAAAMALTQTENTERYGAVKCHENLIVEFKEKNVDAVDVSGLINAGVYALKKQPLTGLLTQPCSLEKDIFPILVKRKTLAGVELNGFFIDIGLPDTLDYTKKNLLKHLR